MKRKVGVLALALTISAAVSGQDFNQRVLTAEFAGVFDPSAITDTVISFMYPVGAPAPGGDSYKSFLAEQKRLQSYTSFPKTSASVFKTTSVPSPTQGFNTSLYRLTPTGNPYPITAGIPNDNALAISKDGIVCAAVNSIFWAYDLNTGELALPTPSGIYSLTQMASGSNLENYYDPKLIYDPEHDRFVLVFLKDNDAANSRIIVAFSSTNHPADPWYVYRLNGNPLNNNRWTDFPAIALSETGLVVTANLIIPGVSWQVGFDGSVIWHLDKLAGYQGGDVRASVYTQISHNGRFVRNLHPVRGHDNISDRLQFLSNRNFDLQNDTIFLITLNEGVTDTTVTTRALISKLPYGVPPNGKQADTDTTDATKGLQTNDARVLGAIQKDDWIQFVSTTAHGNAPTAAIYHGFIDGADGNDPKLSARIFWHEERDYAYPNLAWTGVHGSHIQCLIGFDFTSIADHPGVGAVQLGNDTTFSDPIDLVNGTTFVDRHSDSYERWGDYFSVQNNYDAQGELIPGEVWMAGYYGDGPNQNRTHVAQVFSNDTLIVPHPDGGATFPVPATQDQELTIQFNLDSEQNVRGYLYFTDGRLIQELAGRTLEAGPAEIWIDLSTLRKGHYVVRLIGSAGFEEVRRFIVQ